MRIRLPPSSRRRVALSIFAVGAVTVAVFGCSNARGRGLTPEIAPAVSPEAIAALLETAQVTKKDVVYDLEGAGAVAFAAAQERGARGVAFLSDPAGVASARERVRSAGLHRLVEVSSRTATDEDLSPASVVILPSRPDEAALVAARLKTGLRPGSRVVSTAVKLEGWDAERTVLVRSAGQEQVVRVWTVRGAETPPDLGPFVPTPMAVVQKMLDVADVKPGDVVYDLGSGDGRIVIEAARRGARGVGIEYDARLCEEARLRAEREGVAERVEIRNEDVMRSSFDDATVVCLYLLPQSNERLRARMEALRPGTRIVAHDYRIGDWPPLRSETLALNDAKKHTVFLWRVGE